MSFLEIIPKLVSQGGLVMIALMVLCVLLYERCFNLLLQLRGMRKTNRQFVQNSLPGSQRVRFLQMHLEEILSQKLLTVKALAAAAPLTGLLGTVIGMVRTFESLGVRSSQGSIEGLASGISMALVTTETGLAIAIPAVLLTYLAQRQVQKGVSELAQIQDDGMVSS